MDVTPYLGLSVAPRVVLEAAAERATRPRFMVPDEKGDWRAITWAAFASQIRRAALALRSFGIARGDRACILSHNRVEWLSAALGIQAAGGVMVPIYPASTAAQAGYVLEHSDARVLFVDPALLERALEAKERSGALERIVVLCDDLDPALAPLEPRVLSWSRLLALGAASDEPGAIDALLASVALDDPALMLYTSGTTGDPKGVPLTHRNVAVNGRDWLECNAPLLDEGAVDLLWLPMSHIFGFGEACIGNLLGFTTYLSDPARVLDDLPAVRPTVFMSVPAYWQKIAARAKEAPRGDERRQRIAELTGGRLRFCLSGGAGLEREVKELFYENGLLILEGYGLTECAPTLTLNRPGSFRFDSVGKPLPSVELRLADDGEILARGPNVFSGYHKSSSREAFTDDGWFKTGDVGRFTADGFLQIVDRKKEILVTAGGKNVPPANIEARFSDPIFRHVVVYGDGKKYLTAGVWLDHEAVDARLADRGLSHDEKKAAIEAMVSEAIDRVNSDLARFEQIRRHRIMDVPLTVAGGFLTATLKIRRKKIYQAFGDALEALYQEP